MSEEKKHNRDMTVSLFPEENRKENGPDMTGTITIAGVELRIAVWPAQKGKNSGKMFRSGKVEYKQGATKFLVPVSPSALQITGATATTEPSADAQPASDGGEVNDMPF